MKKNRAVFIVGTTGVGKTKLSIQLAHRFNGEIINADAMQMYHGLNIATAKATVQERDGVPHHLLDEVDPRTEVTVHDFHKRASQIIADLNEQGKLPIVVGGTHYYIQSLIWDSLLDEGERSPEIPTDDLDAKSTEELYAMLQRVDPEPQQHPHQRKRILSDLRLYNQTGVAPSQLRQEHNARQSKEERLDNVVIWLSCQPEVLAARLDKRVDGMLAAGLLAENTAFVQRNIEGSDIGRGVWQAIGLKEFMPLYLDAAGRYNHRTAVDAESAEVQEMVARVKVDTQQYAKRQITWIRNRLLARVQHLIQLDTSQLDRWDDVVLNPAVNVVEHLMAGTLPAVKVNHAFWEQQSESRNKKFVCDVCKKVIMGEEQWHDHLRGRVHKRHVEGLKKKKAAEAYFASKKKEKESSLS
ncbi:tRNA isopentenyltransferase [Blastocystis sp. ATCC 50177/Nand II]|uniref:tRNA isopentenyltransferase n=1 Tax=Blastocystis sp. subtype 1 (strain ATCC 50177 / NandII) TaxID=478820 RepID=A0A196SLI8_BLAHN|nr:tRNA isopentenyltransferase [Blastocystis sp. ATCC 50177/Nand II]